MIPSGIYARTRARVSRRHAGGSTYFTRKHGYVSWRSISISSRTLDSSRLFCIPTLHDNKADIFREKCFNPAVPALMPRETYAFLPAITKWFCTDRQNPNLLQLNAAHLLRFGDPLVPLELTREVAGAHSPAADLFQRFHAPLSLFLAWTRQERQGQDRLYLAQASVSDLPRELQDDLPPPKVVTHAGKDSIYDINLWIGLAPTHTPLHRDPNPNLFVQMAGTKIVRLYEPEAGDKLFRRVQHELGRDGSPVFRGEEMMSGPEKSLLDELVWSPETSKLGQEYSIYEACVQRGDGLFIPKGWWHSIKGVGSGLTASVSKSSEEYQSYSH